MRSVEGRSSGHGSIGSTRPSLDLVSTKRVRAGQLHVDYHNKYYVVAAGVVVQVRQHVTATTTTQHVPTTTTTQHVPTTTTTQHVPTTTTTQHVPTTTATTTTSTTT